MGCSTVGEVHDEEICTTKRSHNQEENHFAPIKVGTLIPLPNQNRRDVTRQFFNISDPLVSCDPNHGRKADSKSAKQLAWLLYLLGMIGMSFLNPLFCVLAMKYANPSILAPFSGLTLVWIILFSHTVLDEYPGRRQKIACALIVAGEVLVAFFGDHMNGVDGGIEGVVRIRIEVVH